VVDGRIVYGFKGIKGVGEWPSGEIISVREEGGPFKDFMDFLERVDIKKVGKSTIEILVQAGAFDAFDADRSTLLANFERVIEYALKKQDDRRNGQGSLFEDTGETEYPDFVFEPAPPMNRHELLQIEKKLLGFYFSGHPLDEYRSSWERSVSLDLGHPDRASPDREYTLLGMIKAIRPFTNKKGKSQAFATLGDFNGDIDLTFFPEIWEKHRDSLAVDKIIALRGKVYTAGERVTFTVTSILDMEDLVEKSYRELHIRLSQNALSGKENLYPLRDRLFEGSGPCSVFIHVPLAAGEGVVRAAAQITAGVEKAAIDDLALCEGVAEAWRE
jgi:DNA polymerase-3 subunit alpha